MSKKKRGGAEDGAPPRLLVLASTYPRWAGDPEPGFVHELARRLVGRFRVTVLCPHAVGAKTRERLDGVDVVRYRYAPAALERLVNDGGIVTNLRRHRSAWLLVPGFVLVQAWTVWRLVRRIRPAVIHAHWLVPQGLIVAGLGMTGIRMPPLLVTSHGADLFALRGRVMSALKRFVLSRAAVTTIVSEGMRDEVALLGSDASRLRVEPMGVDLSGRFCPDPAVRRSRDELLFVGRLVEKKGLRYLLDAMPLILETRPDVTLTIAGFGPEEKRCRALAKSLGIGDRVRFIGAVAQAELPTLYRRAAVFVAPFVQVESGDRDGLGLVLAEALGCGCPVVVSDIPATREFGPSCSGLERCSAGDSEDLTRAIIEMLAREPGGEFPCVSRFDWSSRAQAYTELVNGLLPASAEAAGFHRLSHKD